MITRRKPPFRPFSHDVEQRTWTDHLMQRISRVSQFVLLLPYFQILLQQRICLTCEDGIVFFLFKEICRIFIGQQSLYITLRDSSIDVQVPHLPPQAAAANEVNRYRRPSLDFMKTEDSRPGSIELMLQLLQRRLKVIEN